MHSSTLAVMLRRALLISVAAITAAGAQEPFPGLEAYITKAVQTWKVPGLSIAVVRNDSVLYTKGFGVLSAGGTTPVNDQTLFEIGSSSKAFTATVVAMLVSDGKMRFDDRLAMYLPELKLADPVANEAVTVRDALTHRSGIGRGELVWLGAGISRDEVLHRLRFIKPESPFRSRYSYQNMMYLAAGQAAGKAAGSSWDELVRQRIFTPLGMTSSVTSWRGLSNPNVTTPHGMGERDSVYTKPHFGGENIAPAGAILSNARDMAQWLRFQLADGVVGGKRLVSNAALRETHTPQMLIGGGGGRGAAADSVRVTNFNTYAMGWIIEDYRHALVWQHGGNTDGMTAAVGMLPEHKLGVAVLSNMASAQLPELIMRYIFDRQLGAPMRDLSAETYARLMAARRRADSLRVSQASQPSKTEPPVPLSEFVGTYVDSLYGEATVTLTNQRLELKRGEWYGPLEFVAANNFRWTIFPSSPTGPLNIKFEIGADGKVSGLYFGIAGDVTMLGRKAAPASGRGGRGGAPPGDRR
jgi:CubicO group peptidase (beta-lactamase class C family)